MKTLRVLFYLGILASFLLLALIRRNDRYRLFPIEKGISISTYSDQEVEGSSAINVKSKNGLMVEYLLKDKFLYPYCGITFRKNDYSSFNLADKAIEFLNLTIKVERRQKLILILNQYQGSGKLNYIHLQTSLDCFPDQTEYTIPLNNFVSPDWWLKQHQDEKNNPIDYNSINTLSLQSDSTIEPDISQKFMLLDVYFSKSVIFLLYAISLFILGVVIVEVLLWAGRKRKKIVIEYLPIQEANDTRESPWAKIQNYVGKNYQKEIKLQEVFRETGLPKHQISTIIKQQTGLSFPQFLNTIRIAEAERLLTTSTMSIIQIGLEVGFQNITHFNRVFKQLKAQSPSEFRQSSFKEQVVSD